MAPLGATNDPFNFINRVPRCLDRFVLDLIFSFLVRYNGKLKEQERGNDKIDQGKRISSCVSKCVIFLESKDTYIS